MTTLNATVPEEESFHVRPRFRIELDMPVSELETRLKRSLEKENAPVKGRVITGHATFYLPIDQQHYWSPQLGISFEENNDGTLLRGLYGPRPQVWTMFVLFYSIIGFAALVISVFGLSYWSLGKPVAFMWWVPVLGALFLTLYLVAYYGQRLGKEQLKILDRFLKDAIRTP
ncbi:hypothetical protein [Fulvivirga sedimenti]|uniref:GTP-binding protein n=1 Tax=Fulvivirga sedimenti TaxID=2879465 RepID=A0A9X1HWA6_9BACT|nr:hypothetical protein [Fulvivirga sedimenti]MCA6079110.1 hypothetical protein [Fulvivirga sedimenti]